MSLLRKGSRGKNKKERNQRQTVNVGQQLEELLKTKQQAQIWTEKLSEQYPELAMRLAQQMVKSLSKQIDRVQSGGYDPIDFANEVFTLLVESDYKNFINTKADYEEWESLNQKFMS